MIAFSKDTTGTISKMFSDISKAGVKGEVGNETVMNFVSYECGIEVLVPKLQDHVNERNLTRESETYRNS